MGYDRKYGKITTEFGNIGEDEPVVVFRAQDALLADILPYYALRCMKRGSPARHILIIYNTLKTVVTWQILNASKVKTPDSESSKERLEN